MSEFKGAGRWILDEETNMVNGRSPFEMRQLSDLGAGARFCVGVPRFERYTGKSIDGELYRDVMKVQESLILDVELWLEKAKQYLQAKSSA